MKRELKGVDGSALAYYYFSYQSGPSGNIASCLRSLIAQFSGLERRIPVAVLKLFKQYSTENKQPDPFSLVDVLLSLIRRQRHTFVVIDAIDEAANTAEILEIVSLLVERKLDNLHLLVSSRLEITIKEKLESLPTLTVSMEERATDEKFLYIQKCIQENPSMRRWEESLKREIEVSLMRGTGSK